MGVKTLLDLSGRVALVTGGSRGLGLQIAEALGEMGAKLAITARKKDELEAAVSHLEKQKIHSALYVCDIGKRETIAPLADEVLRKFGKVDILVNNAGATWGAPAEKHPLEAWDKLVNVNLSGLFALTQLIAARSMIPAKWGRIINIASVAGLLGQDPRFAPTAAYTATKHGVVGLTRQLAAEWGVHGITVNAICPGFFPSKMTRATLETTGKLIQDWTPTRRLGGEEMFSKPQQTVWDANSYDERPPDPRGILLLRHLSSIESMAHNLPSYAPLKNARRAFWLSPTSHDPA
jgi:NAD(P)-dependent dehydrogenase (short-subunit alcohol dehydrogenase family)